MKLPAAKEANQASQDWYVVVTWPNAERRAARSLRRAGYRVYVPKMRKDIRQRRTGKWKQQRLALMPGYVMVRMTRRTSDGREDWYALRTAEGVASVLGHADQPTALPRHMVRRIMLAQRHGTFDVLRKQGRAAQRRDLEKRFPRNATFRILDGPFGGFDLTVTRIAGPSSVTGDVTTFGRPLAVTVHVDQLGALDEFAKAA